MCGIAGILTNNSQIGLEKYVQLMQTAINHRGPDDRGIYLSSDRTVAIAHTRLAILDLSENGHQPMHIDNQRYWITFNGEIYNFLELMAHLKNEGETFFSHTDTEVILKLYAKYGEDCLSLMRGMFAFAIWDDLKKECFIARDPLGIKPLYYSYQNSTLIFASEIRSVLSTGLIPKQLSAIGLYSYLINGSISEPYTIIEGIQSLEAGCWLKWKDGNIQKHQYWEINFPSQNNSSAITKDEAILKTRNALFDSVKHHFISDVPVGVFLSGGIDSTAIVAIARQLGNTDLRTYSIVFNEEKWNEGPIARQVAKDFGTLHTEYLLTPEVGKKLLPEYWKTLDQPTIDGLNTFCVSQIAHQHGMKVVLSGLGSDEIFGGYDTFQKVPSIFQQRHSFSFFDAISKITGKRIEKLYRSPKYRRLGAFLAKENSIKNSYGLARGVFSDWEAMQLVQFYLGEDLGDRLQSEITNFSAINNYSSLSFPTPEDEVSYLELSRYMRNQLLRDSDVMSMKWGLELRVPFVDSHLFKEVSQIPASQRLQKSKLLLTSAIPEIPAYITNRRKRGFTFPFEKWISEDWGDYTMDIKVPRQIPLTRKQWYRRWSLVVLQNWWQTISA
ncbi:asparagine synthase (glutamine-hydrolyzing) [Pseudanabaena sp. FACHB-1998]|uniref:asparagine synthase (glutamine-hydrolyzing) n=1 Tax=Pseudanabaena sp. FACHB-1998 TaxID=2692858 RepID=UPI001680DF11|nr:asparagine synthase (glutamine-hydrolyzing) [Pseudanabaena sp. FACHB-1998]MBD2175906.1 asparagine synthase (glutamine-hydrolyzing) [Pseudanabaena sp. FACHB-1998]